MPARLTPAERKLRARIAAHARWANEDPAHASAAARRRLLARFEREVNPEITDPAVRTRLADHALRQHMASLAFKSAKARRLKKAS